MTINRKPCGDESRVVKALVEQVSQIQEDISELGNEIDGLDQSKVSKVDLADSVTTDSLTAGSANIGKTTITDEQLSTNKASAGDLYSPNADFEYEHANNGYIEDLTTDALTVNGDETVVNLNAQRVTVADSLTVPDITTEEVTATNVTASGRVSANNVATQTVNADRSNVKVENVSKELNVKDLHITGEITGLNNVDINAKSIVTPVLDADSITTGGIVTSDVNHLIPSPHLDNNDHYTIVLPIFTGTMVLKWADEKGNELWSATVIGNGSDYSIHWGTKADSITVTKLYQYNKHLYIRENANGSLYYSYHTTDEIEEPSVLYNYTRLDNEVTEAYKYNVTTMSGTFNFGSFYASSFIAQTGNVSQELNVKDLHITGEITGLNNVDINAKSIVTSVLDADFITTGGIVTSEANHLTPSPNLDNNDHYTIVLPIFTGVMILKWSDPKGNEVWSATVTGNGSDYSIHWGTKADGITVTKLYQYRKHLYIRENANGSLYYSYHTTEEIEEPDVLYNYTELDSIITEAYKYDATTMSGTFNFGSFYAPSFIAQTGSSTLDDVEINKLRVNGQLDIVPPTISWADKDVKVCDNFTTDWIKK